MITRAVETHRLVHLSIIFFASVLPFPVNFELILKNRVELDPAREVFEPGKFLATVHKDTPMTKLREGYSHLAKRVESRFLPHY